MVSQVRDRCNTCAGGCREPRCIRSPGRGSQRLHRALGGTRILLAAAPTAPPCFCRWQRSSLLHRGFFTRRTVRRVDAVRIHPPSLREGYYKTETPVPGSDTGVLGGRGWIRTTEAEKQQIYSLSPLATREHAQILFTSVAGRLVYFIRLRAICQLLFSDFCSFSAEAVGRVSFGSDVSGARNPARRQWLRRTWGIGQ